MPKRAARGHLLRHQAREPGIPENSGQAQRVGITGRVNRRMGFSKKVTSRHQFEWRQA
jgi:hypothetical protein